MYGVGLSGGVVKMSSSESGSGSVSESEDDSSSERKNCTVEEVSPSDFSFPPDFLYFDRSLFLPPDGDWEALRGGIFGGSSFGGSFFLSSFFFF